MNTQSGRTSSCVNFALYARVCATTNSSSMTVGASVTSICISPLLNGLLASIVCDLCRHVERPKLREPGLGPTSNWRSGPPLICPCQAEVGRVEMWRGSSRFGLSVAASFVWRCPNNFTLTPFPHPAHRTGHADLPHPALGQDITPSYTAGSQPWTGQTH